MHHQMIRSTIYLSVFLMLIVLSTIPIESDSHILEEDRARIDEHCRRCPNIHYCTEWAIKPTKWLMARIAAETIGLEGEC